MKGFKIKWLKKKDLKNSVLVKGVPGIGSISHISVDYIIKKLEAELVCKIYSDYLPNIVLINKDSIVEQPCYKLYYKKAGKNKILFLTNNYPPTKEYYSYLTCEFLANFLKRIGVGKLITIAGIAYKEMPKKIKLHCAIASDKLKKELEKNTNLVFDGNKSVGLIIGSAGLLLTYCVRNKIPGFCILVSTWGHPNYVGIKESKKTIQFLKDYLKFDIDFTDLNKEIKRLNKEAKRVDYSKQIKEQAEFNKSRYIG